MAEAKLIQLFNYKSVTPSNLTQGNLISFKYKSPEGVHDKAPLVFVLNKEADRFYGVNLHYDMGDLQSLIEGVEDKVNTFLEAQWYMKHPEKRKELREQRAEFDKSMIENKEYIQFKNRFNKKDLEKFSIPGFDDTAFRTYLFKRMNNVSKLVWKL